MIIPTSLIVPLALAPAIGTRNLQLRGGYKDNCMAGFLYDHGEMYGHFTATCWTDANDIHTYKSTTIDLNHCLTNQYGVLGWGSDGQAMKTCQCASRRGEASIINCQCMTDHGSDTSSSSMDMNEGIYTTPDGRLACFDITGT